MKRKLVLPKVKFERPNVKQMVRKNWKSICLVAVILILSFFMGRGVAVQREKILASSAAASKSSDWGLGFGTEGSQPTGNGTPDEMAEYDAYYVGDDEDKVIYLTFDCGYENGNTPAILEALKKHNAQATFFVVGNFVTENPDLIKQMVADGHTVGNHTMHHRDVSTMGQAEFEQEIEAVEEAYKEITGEEMVKYYRAPQGKYSIENLKMAQSMGYKTIFWSLAYVDWNQDSQPTKEEAFDKLLTRIHPGAVVLLHNTSSTNAEILDELLTKWEEMGYRFEPLSNLINSYDTEDENSESNTESDSENDVDTNSDNIENNIEESTVSPDVPSVDMNSQTQET